MPGLPQEEAQPLPEPSQAGVRQFPGVRQAEVQPLPEARQAQAGFTSASISLLQAYNNYKWEVEGIG